MTELALPRARTRRIKPPPRDWFAAMAIGIFQGAWFVYDVLRIINGEVKLHIAISAAIDYVYFRAAWPYLLHPDRWPGILPWLLSMPLRAMLALATANVVLIIAGV